MIETTLEEIEACVKHLIAERDSLRARMEVHAKTKETVEAMRDTILTLQQEKDESVRVAEGSRRKEAEAREQIATLEARLAASTQSDNEQLASVKAERLHLERMAATAKADAEARVEAIQTQLEAVQKELAASKADADARVEASLTDANARVEALQTQLGAAQKELATVQASRNAERTRVKAERDTARERAQELETQAAAAVARANQSDTEIKTLQATIAQLEAANAKAESVLASQSTNSKTEVKRLREERNAARATCADLQATVAQLESSIQSLKASPASPDTEAELENERARAQGLAARIQRLTQEVSHAQMEKSEAEILHRNALEEIQKPYAKAQKDVERLKTVLLDTEERHAERLLAVERENERLKHELEVTGKSSAETTQSVAAKLASAEAQLLASREETGVLSAQVERLETENANLVSIVNQLQDAQDELVAARVEDTTAQLGQTQEELQSALSKLEVIDALEAELATARETQVRTQTRLSRTNTELHTAQDELVALKASMTKMAQAQQELTSSDARIDKAIVANLLVTYFSKAESEKTPVLRVLASMLDLSEAQEASLGLHADDSGLSGWLGSWFGGPTHSSAPSYPGAPTPHSSDQPKGLSDLWVEFLLLHADGDAESYAAQSPSSTSDSAPPPSTGEDEQESTGLAAIDAGVVAIS